MDLEIRHVHEEQIDSNFKAELSQLLEISFPDVFHDRIYFKQLPHQRFVARRYGKLVGQLGVDHRIINVGGTILTIAGVIDLCVHPDFRLQGVGSKLLQSFEKSMQNVDFYILMADTQTLYYRNGYQSLTEAPTKWLAIEERETYGVIERDLSDCFMIKSALKTDWPSGQIDMLGYLF